MAELLSPGVFIEEVPTSAQVVQPVSTSTMGIVGGAARGPVDEAVLVTSYDEFTRVFGPQIRDSRLSLSMAAYFANGGRRAYVVRVAPADAVAANLVLPTARYDETVYISATPAALMGSAIAGGVALDGLVVPGSVSLRWRSAGAPVVSSVLRNTDNTANLAGDGSELLFTGRVNPSAIPAYIPTETAALLPSIDPSATLEVTFTTGASPETIVLTTTAGGLVATGTNGGGSSATLDLVTGTISLEFDATEAPDNATTIGLSFTPTAVEAAVDDGAGVLTGDLTGPGTITYATGVWSATATNATIDNYPVVVSYRVASWVITPVSPGAWANDVKVQVRGNSDFYTLATNSFSRFDVFVRMLNTATGNYDIVEVYEEVVFDDPTSSVYFPDVINDLSDLIRVTTPSNQDEAPGQLSGLARSRVIAGGNEDSAGSTLTGFLSAMRARTLTISYQDSTGAPRTITDDGAGNLVGDVDPAGTNTISYTTGQYNVTVDGLIDANTLVTATWRGVAETSLVDEQFGDTTKDFTVSGTNYYEEGENGTYDATNFGRNQFSAPALEATDEGLYALNLVEELLQVIVPDFAGDTLITGDLLDYVDSRATQPQGGDRFAILTVPAGSSAQEAVDYFRFDLARNSDYAAMYWPWVKVADPLRDNRPVVFPPLGHIAGVYARVDQTRNVGKSPGGTIDGALRFLTGLEQNTSQGHRDLVAPNKINCLISSPQTGTAVWGVRTISAQSQWRYINARRLFMFVERSVWNSTFWIAFENNGPSLWARVKAQLEGFLLGLFTEGYFAGSTPSQAFFVRCDETNNSAASIEAGQVIIDVGIAPNRPAEFIRFRFQVKSLNS